jgi:hypothetical protein
VFQKQEAASFPNQLQWAATPHYTSSYNNMRDNNKVNTYRLCLEISDAPWMPAGELTVDHPKS